MASVSAMTRSSSATRTFGFVVVGIVLQVPEG
jgi:hypothetical protein